MEAKKIDLWVIGLAILTYGIVNVFHLMPDEFYFENTIMLSLLFALGLVSYFSGLLVSLGLAALTIFFYGSYVIYGNVVHGQAVQSHVYYWLVFLPLVAV